MSATNVTGGTYSPWIQVAGGIVLVGVGIYLILSHLVGFAEGFIGLILLAIGVWLIYNSGI